jgi:ATP-dependent helicase/nuclease subunit A
MQKAFFNICGEKENIDNIVANMQNSLGVVKEFVGLVEKFETEYSAIKKQKKALDFDDLEKYALELLENPVLCQAVKEKYDVVYIDEYQDINNKQEKILSLVTKGDNMVMVGDLKQSIYGFRNSSPQILIDKTALYKKNIGGNLITLKENFRSNPLILDFVNSIFNKVMKEEFGGIDYKTDGAFKGAAKYQRVED